MKNFFFVLILLAGCTTKEIIKPPIPQPTIDTLLVQDTIYQENNHYYESVKIDTVYHDTTIIKYYPKDSQFILQQSNNLLRHFDAMQQRLIRLEMSGDSIKSAIKKLDKEPKSYPFMSKLGWAFIGTIIVIFVGLLIGIIIFFKFIL